MAGFLVQAEKLSKVHQLTGFFWDFFTMCIESKPIRDTYSVCPICLQDVRAKVQIKHDFYNF